MATSRDCLKLLTLPAVSRVRGVPLHALYQAAGREFPVYRVDSWPRTRLEHVDAWLRRCERGPGAHEGEDR
jgi:hypothetical protein